MLAKQKNFITIVTFGCIVTLMGALFLAVVPTNVAYAIEIEAEICADEDIITGPVTRAACQDAVANGENPCSAIFKALEDDGNDAAGEKRKACETARSSLPDCTPGSPGCCGGVKTSIIDGSLCGGKEDGTEGGTIYALLIGVLNILTAGIGIAAVGGIAYGALLYTTAENKPDQTKKAIGIITNVVIGIVAYGLMFVLLNFLIPGGIFT